MATYLPRVAPDTLAISSRAGHSTGIRRRRQRTSKFLSRTTAPPILWRAMMPPKLRRTIGKNVSGNRRQRIRMSSPCATCPPARRARAPVHDSCRVARHPRAHKKTPAALVSIGHPFDDNKHRVSPDDSQRTAPMVQNQKIIVVLIIAGLLACCDCCAGSVYWQ